MASLHAKHDGRRRRRRSIAARLAVSTLVAAAATIPGVVAARAGSSFAAFADGAPAAALSLRGSAFARQPLVSGRPREGIILIRNAGSATGYFSLAAAARGDAKLLRHVAVRIRSTGRTGGTVLYEGEAAGLRGVAIGAIRAGASKRLLVRLTLPHASGNPIQGLEEHLDFVVSVAGLPSA